MSIDRQKLSDIESEVIVCNALLKATICSLDFRDNNPMAMQNDDIWHCLSIVHKRMEDVESKLSNFNIE